MRERLQDDIAVVIGFDVVQSDDPWQIQSSIHCPALFVIFGFINEIDFLLSERWIQDILYVIQAGIDNLVIIWQAVESQVG